MRAWLIFMKERFPLLVYGLLSFGFSYSAALLFDDSFDWALAALSLIGWFLFFFDLRVMDEYKDYKKDLIAHPERPLPRGLITKAQAKNAIYMTTALMLFFGFFLWVYLGKPAGVWYMGAACYLVLMFREFFVGRFLNKEPFLYATSHQVVLFPMIFFSATLFDPVSLLDKPALQYSALCFFAFFTYEICRKLDPKAPLILGTYWRICGPVHTSLALFCLSVALSLTSVVLFQSWYFLPFSLAIPAFLCVFWFRPHMFKWVERAGSASLIAHIWSVGLWRMFQ